jgi:imidazolonepropionase
MAKVDTLEDAFLLVENGHVVALGPKAMAPEADRIISLENKEVIPGLVDSHTHSVFAAPREEEFVMRIKGASYEEIAEAGGGILNSARKLRSASEDELFEAALLRLRDMIRCGSTTIEIKSGYGLSVEGELKMLRVIKRLKQALPITIKATFLGAHAFPEAFKSRKDDYVQLVSKDMLSAIVAEELADHVDVFCEHGFFSPDQTARVLNAAKTFGLPAKIHGNQLGYSGGVQVAVAHEAWSVDHLEFTGPEEWQVLADGFQKPYGGTLPVALPGVSYFLGLPYTRGREMIDFGLPLVLATDFNPGSSPINSLQMVMSLACTQMKLIPEEAFHAVTVNAAAALRINNQVGSLAPGCQADFLIMKSKNTLALMPYFVGQNQVESVYVKGQKFD